ncbi:angiopoietin-4-like [Physella acuta]|uniref:angiopoietin-4-like n=1 Tax=Physella acuta TaxID=109671 RepID=UPI0027DAFE9C|nr:angiopoietin-4-like [Physella acuta]
MFAVLCNLLIATTFISINGLKIDMSREYFYHGKDLFCGQLQCTENIREDTQISALVNMSVYRISEPEGKILLASISESDSKLQDYKRAGTRVDGKISKTFSELNIFFSNHSDCNDGVFLCEFHYVNTTRSVDRIGKETNSLQRKSRESFIIMNLKAKTSDYVKSVDTMADFLKSFEDPDRLKGADMTMSLQMSHSGGDKFSTDKSFGPTHTELNHIFKQISSSKIEDIMDDKIKNLTADFNETLHQMENKITTAMEKEVNKIILPYIETQKLDKGNSQGMLDYKIGNLTLNFNETLQHMEHKIATKVEKEIDKRISSYIETHKLDQETLTSLNKSVQTITAGTQKQIEQWNLKFAQMEEKLKKTETREDFNTTLNMMYDINKTMHTFLDEYNHMCVRSYRPSLPDRIITNLNETKIALCDTKTDGGGWVIIQRRVKGDVNFTRNWSDYKNGFGSLAGDYWLGNDWISYLTQNGYSELRFDMKYKGKSYYAVYSDVAVGNEKELYRIQFTYKISNVDNSFETQNSMAFSTIDRENDMDSNRNCAQIFKGGWWYNYCHLVNVNGVWEGTIYGEGLNWESLTGSYESLEYVEMKLRQA